MAEKVKELKAGFLRIGILSPDGKTPLEGTTKDIPVKAAERVFSLPPNGRPGNYGKYSIIAGKPDFEVATEAASNNGIESLVGRVAALEAAIAKLTA